MHVVAISVRLDLWPTIHQRGENGFFGVRDGVVAIGFQKAWALTGFMHLIHGLTGFMAHALMSARVSKQALSLIHI